jgi:hypothetical protein
MRKTLPVEWFQSQITPGPGHPDSTEIESRYRRIGRIDRREIHRTPGDDGGDSVLVNHLRHCVAQQHHILVERLDLTLQFDAIDQINGHWNMLPAQDVQKRVLKELPFVAHDMFRVQELL